MNRTYNHIKHLVERNDQIESYNNTLGRKRTRYEQAGKHHANQVNGKQRHSGFDYYYESDMLIIGSPGGWAQFSLDRSNLYFQERVEDLEYDQARHQGVHGHGRGQSR